LGEVLGEAQWGHGASKFRGPVNLEVRRTLPAVRTIVARPPGHQLIRSLRETHIKINAEQIIGAVTTSLKGRERR
jgi:hypothetical protein